MELWELLREYGPAIHPGFGAAASLAWAICATLWRAHRSLITGIRDQMQALQQDLSNTRMEIDVIKSSFGPIKEALNDLQEHAEEYTEKIGILAGKLDIVFKFIESRACNAKPENCPKRRL